VGLLRGIGGRDRGDGGRCLERVSVVRVAHRESRVYILGDDSGHSICSHIVNDRNLDQRELWEKEGWRMDESLMIKEAISHVPFGFPSEVEPLRNLLGSAGGFADGRRVRREATAEGICRPLLLDGPEEDEGCRRDMFS
jgi:hypothetical protein